MSQDSVDQNNGQEGTKPKPEQPGPALSEHLNIKVTDGNNEVFFKIKKSTKLEKLMKAFAERQGKDPRAIRFLFDGQNINGDSTPDSLEMQDGDTIEVHQEQIGGRAFLI